MKKAIIIILVIYVVAVIVRSIGAQQFVWQPFGRGRAL